MNNNKNKQNGFYKILERHEQKKKLLEDHKYVEKGKKNLEEYKNKISKNVLIKNIISNYKFIYYPSESFNKRYQLLNIKSIAGSENKPLEYLSEEQLIKGFMTILETNNNISLYKLLNIDETKLKNEGKRNEIEVPKSASELTNDTITYFQSLFFSKNDHYKTDRLKYKDIFGFSNLKTIDIKVYNPAETTLYKNRFGQNCLNSFIPGEFFNYKKSLIENNDKALKLYEDVNKFKNIKIHLNNLLGGEKVSFFYFCNSLSHSLKNPSDKRAQSFAFKAYADGNGLDGAGKNGFFAYILNPIFGEPNTSIITDDRLNSNFNTIFFNKLFVGLDEADITNNKTINKFKSYSGAYTATQEAKGKDAKTDKLYFKSILFSNSVDPVKIKKSDRRWSFFRPVGKLGDTDFDFKNMWGNNGFDELTDLNIKELKEFVTFLRYLEVDFNKIELPLSNNLRDDAIESSRNAFELFINEIKYFKNVDSFLDSINIEFGFRFNYISNRTDESRSECITTNDLYLLFGSWCVNKGYDYKIKSIKFNRYFRDSLNIDKIQAKVEGKTSPQILYLIKDIFPNSDVLSSKVIKEDL